MTHVFLAITIYFSVISNKLLPYLIIDLTILPFWNEIEAEEIILNVDKHRMSH